MDSPRTPLQRFEESSTYFFVKPPTYDLLLDHMEKSNKILVQEVTKRQLTFDNMLLEIHELREELETYSYALLYESHKNKLLETELASVRRKLFLDDVDEEESS